MSIVVILPMYNEEDNALLILEHLHLVRQKYKLELHLLAVNDGSQDGTEKNLLAIKKQLSDFDFISYPKNKGLGGALQEGIEAALKKNFDVLLFMDADLTHDGNDIPKFLDKINEGYDLVLGSRFVPGGKMVGVPLPRVLISKVGNLFGRFLLGVPVRDYTTGYRAIKQAVFRKITLTEGGFGVQLEETVKAAAAGFRLGEVPITLTTRKFGNSKMVYNWNLISSYFQLFKKCWQWKKQRVGQS